MNILVTGASRGIGYAIAKELENVGNIFVTARSEDVLKTFGEGGYCVCDLSGDLTKLKDFIRDKKIDVLINNAGEYVYGGLETQSDEVINHQILTNLIAPIELAGCVLPYMKSKNWGRIINIGSISGVMGEGYASVYSASKSGLVGFSKALALEVAEFGITVNTINPGWVETDLGLKSIDDSEFSYDEVVESIPQRRFVSPSEVAGLCRYLISDDAKGITGQSINLCAGLSVGI